MAGRGAAWKRWLKLLFSLGLGAGLLWLIFHDIDLAEFMGYIKATRLGWWSLCLVTFLGLHLSRAWRWGKIVERIQPVGFRGILSINSVGFLAIQSLPFRLGEFARPYLLHEREDVPFGSAMYTVVVERSIDILALAVMFGVVVFFADIPLETFVLGEWEVRFVDEGRKAIGIAAVPFGGCLLAFLVLQERAVRWTEAIVGRVHQGLARKAAGMMQSFLDGVRTMKDLRFGATMLSSTIFIWCLNIVCMWALLVAFNLELSPMAALVLLVVLVVGVLLPAPPLFAGVFEAFVIGGLALYGVGKDEAAAYAVVCHVTQTIVIFGIGLAFLWIDQISFAKIIQFARTVSEDDAD
jgi:glycosyltransferase 2 family protein